MSAKTGNAVEPPGETPPGVFDGVAPFYELLANVYSLGCIRAAKASQLDWIQAGDRVLYVGVGGGEDAVQAAERGAEVTCIDLSAGMLRRVEAKLQAAGATAECIRGDALEHDRVGYYDVATANFFLNCFHEPEMRGALAHVANLVRPGGKLLIADVAVPQGNLVYRTLHRIHNGVGIVFFWLLGLVPLHRIYDYREYFPEAGLATGQVRSFRLLKLGPVSYESIAATKLDGPPAKAPDSTPQTRP